MLADAVNPEADDEFSYEEDPRTALLAHLFTDGIPGLARHRSPREPGLLSPPPPPVETGPIFLRNPVIPIPQTYRDAVTAAWGTPEQLRHRLEDVAATFGVDLDEPITSIPGLLPRHHDPVEHPSHYTSHPSGVECIDVTEHMNFNLGNVVKYVWRAGLKGDTLVLEDLKKGLWYLEREIGRLSS